MGDLTLSAVRPSSESGTCSVQPVILAGGAGTRLWPLSREDCPKQLIGLVGEASLLEATVRRIQHAFARQEGGPRDEEGARGERPSGAGPHEAGPDDAGRREDALAGMSVAAPLVVCSEQLRLPTLERLERCSAMPRVLLEPVPRNTAPALTVAALAARGPGLRDDPVLVAMPADHLIADEDAFAGALRRAVAHAGRGTIVALGVPPTCVQTGYGYIRLGAAADGEGARAIGRFVEKPGEELARQYVESGGYWWNSGIFVVRASVWLDAIARCRPPIAAACAASWQRVRRDAAGVLHLDAEAFGACPSDSIDYAVMERIGVDGGLAGVAVPLVAGWSDVGAWDAVWALSTKDAHGNVARGRVLLEGATDTFAHSDGRLVACVGVTGVVVIETADAVLVAAKHRVQEVKAIVERLKAGHGSEAQQHRKVERPWGCYDSLDRGERFQVKRIVVKPGGRLSLQMHHHRAEHWVVVRGTARVTRGETCFLLSENESAYIPVGVAHRLENPGRMPLEVIEVQSGGYLGEDDIVRFDDQYGRVP
ncbi:mannose-1-phosphate guanylyltransferase/mannose-6-phosphate isomerase [Burkholderia sp. WAC0059]|uniref:mannose-1-phosphate guanylyltransferase/mannose-6-phosphate isomerase n=1 Tax=Burkholderia sp. WAC0059 TaxID=2066022 RepID=UPI000C7EBD17|nr:mannose-1-phosphate guanylyltransferase/mannose-6-phosphate isomerase [Burkholderia sp. WAC0059]PLZ03580.1 mannose-1-phosphate guanylyltransferase/mannose-6-phosphate isomerase [Burkholderia sp. WAC0059]